MRVNKELVHTEYTDYFKAEYMKCGQKIEETKKQLLENRDQTRVTVIQNKIAHLTDRQNSAKAVLDNNFDVYDLLAADVYTMIWGNSADDDAYRSMREDPNTILYKIRELKRVEPVKHLREYCTTELAEYTNNYIRNDYDISRVVEW